MKTLKQMALDYANPKFKGCNPYDDEADVQRNYCIIDFIAGYQAAKDDVNSSNNSNGWISVKERLPEEGQDCIFYVDFIDKWDKESEIINLQEIGVFNGKDRFYHRSHTHLDRVSYWMPLPKPPEDK